MHRYRRNICNVSFQYIKYFRIFFKKNVAYVNIICIINTKYFIFAKLETNLIKSEIYSDLFRSTVC